MNMKTADTSAGFTLFEILIVMSILAFLLMVSIVSWQGQLQHAFDAQRKGALSNLKAALEHYANDHGCYPAPAQMTCDSTIFSSYNMPKVLCDPEGKQPYRYELVDGSDACKGFRIYAIIKDPKDLDIARVGCDRPQGCGITDHPEYNYGVSNAGPVAQ